MIELIPAIDLIDGKCVRLTKGDYTTKKVYADDPVEMAKRLEQMGFSRLHVVDLDGARNRRVANDRVLRDITRQTGLRVDFGGGVRSDADVERILEAGAEMVTVGSIAVSQPATYLRWFATYGADHLILGADVRDGLISIHGWQEKSSLGLDDFLGRYLAAGTRNVLCTEISRDGMLQGPATELYRRVMQAHPQCHLIASGGVACIEDIEQLEAAGVPAVVFGKALYEGRIDPEALLQRMNRKEEAC